MKRILLLLILGALMAGCAKTTQDFAHYRGLSASQIFNSGEHALAKNNDSKAVKDFQALDAIYPFGQYSRQGRLDIIYAYYKAGDTASALAAADRYVHLYPRGPYVDYAYYMKGTLEYNEGMTWLQRMAKSDPAPHDLGSKKQAFMDYSQIVSFYRHSVYAPFAAQHMLFIRNIIAQKSVLVAHYYLQRGAYIAAANRAAYVVLHFDGSPEVIPSLAIMVEAYRYMHLDVMANTTMQVFQASYPNSKQLAALKTSQYPRILIPHDYRLF